MPQKKRDLHQKKTLLDLENQVALSLHRGAGNCSINLSGLVCILKIHSPQYRPKLITRKQMVIILVIMQFRTRGRREAFSKRE